MIAIGLIAALAGPFGSYALPIGLRVADWLLFALGGYLFFRPVIAGGAALAEGSALPRPLCIALACALAALPTTLLVAWATSGLRLSRVTVADLAGLYSQVLLIGGAATVLQLALRRRVPAPETPMPPDLPASVPPSPAMPPFLARLPQHLGTDLLALRNEDHYVRVYTAAGDTLLLMRLRDAAAELEQVDGLRVHRSWWVARAALAETLRRDRAIVLRLVNGLEVPVSREAVPALRAAGWL